MDFESIDLTMPRKTLKENLPDVSYEQSAEIEGVLDQVGMTRVELPIKIQVGGVGDEAVVAAVEVLSRAGAMGVGNRCVSQSAG